MISYLHIFEAREKVRFEPKGEEKKTSTEESLLVILDVSESDSAATQKNSFKIKRRACMIQ